MTRQIPGFLTQQQKRKNEMAIYILSSENLTQLGGPMGTERTSINWTKYCKTVEQAKKIAEKDYNKSRGPIEWIKEGKDGWRTQDLGYVMYHIKKIKVEK